MNRPVRSAVYNNHVVDRFASKEAKRVTLKQLTVFGRSMTEEKLIRSGNYVRSELPVRIAHGIRAFQNLPFIVGTNPRIEYIYNLYWEAFESFRNFPLISNLTENNQFCELIHNMLKKHLVAIPQLAMGIAESSQYMDTTEADQFMNEMLRSRIGRRVLAEQHIALTQDFARHSSTTFDHVYGIVNAKCHSGSLVRKSQSTVSDLFFELYQLAPPDIHLDGNLDATFTYIPAHLEYILFELLKNSVYFTIKRHDPALMVKNAIISDHAKRERNLPSISVTIAKDESEGTIIFRISDQGGGISKSVLENMWSFAHISKQRYLKNLRHMPKLEAKVDELVPPSLQLGLGLCMSRAYANYWGGDIIVHSMNGYGTDVYVKISTGNRMEQLMCTKKDVSLDYPVSSD